MDTDRGKVHREADSIVGQQEPDEDGIDYVVTVCRTEVHYVRAVHGAAAITLALDRAPDWEGMDVYVEDDEGGGEEGDASECPLEEQDDLEP